MNKLDKLKSIISNLEVDLGKFYDKGNKAASVRARKYLQEVKAIAQDIRVEISETRREREEV